MLGSESILKLMNCAKECVSAGILSVTQGCIQKFLGWLPGVRTASVMALCH
jgi:hypothetical protein